MSIGCLDKLQGMVAQIIWVLWEVKIYATVACPIGPLAVYIEKQNIHWEWQQLARMTFLLLQFNYYKLALKLLLLDLIPNTPKSWAKYFTDFLRHRFGIILEIKQALLEVN